MLVSMWMIILINHFYRFWKKHEQNNDVGGFVETENEL